MAEWLYKNTNSLNH